MATLGGAVCYMAFLFAFAIGAWWTPSSAVAALYCMFPLKQCSQSTILYLAAHPQITNIAIGLIVTLALARLHGSLSNRLLESPKSFMLTMMLLGYALISVTWTPAVDAAIANWKTAAPYLVIAVLMTPLTISNITEMRSALRWLIWCGGGLSLVLLFVGDWGSRGLVLAGNLTETETNPLAIAAMAGSTAIAAMLLKPHGFGLVQRSVSIASGLGAVFLIIRSGSRGELLALLMALVVATPIRFSLSRLRDWLALATLLIVTTAGYFIGMSSYKGGGNERWTTDYVTADATNRFSMAIALLQAWEKKLTSMIFGLGNSAAFDSHIVGFYPHVMPAEVLGEEGIIGFALLTCIIGLSAVHSLKLLKQPNKEPAQSDVIAAAVALNAFAFIVSCKEGSLLGNYIFFTASIVICRLRIDTNAPGHDQPGPCVATTNEPRVKAIPNLLN